MGLRIFNFANINKLCWRFMNCCQHFNELIVLEFPLSRFRPLRPPLRPETLTAMWPSVLQGPGNRQHCFGFSPVTHPTPTSPNCLSKMIRQTSKTRQTIGRRQPLNMVKRSTPEWVTIIRSYKSLITSILGVLVHTYFILVVGSEI